MSGWLYLITAFGSWFTAGTIFGVMFMSGRLRPAPYSSPGCGQEITTPGAGEPDLAPGVASNP
ncbi:hypothetical protein [Nocardia brasiliensis]|uniref:hypothetical protein n=1 Tax=Nocardia brasiliensis TaxID=37326 RepID=UPI00245846FB|nr:hypothetical protein [Nocardia brasiliensis]